MSSTRGSALTPSKQALEAAFVYDHVNGTLTRRVKRSRYKSDAAAEISNTGYPRTCFKGVRYLTHRLVYIMVHGEIPEGMEIDHINQNKLDFRISNLRAVPRSVNMENRGVMRNNTSGFKGVSFHVRKGAWFGRKQVQGTRQYTRPCPTAEEAYHALQSL